MELEVPRLRCRCGKSVPIEHLGFGRRQRATATITGGATVVRGHGASAVFQGGHSVPTWECDDSLYDAR